MTQHTDSERAGFEAWWSSPHVWSHGHKEAQWAAWQAASRAPVVPQFSHVAKTKLNYLLEAGEAITGYAIENKDGRRGAIDCHGFVYWWQVAAAPMPPDLDIDTQELEHTRREAESLAWSLFNRHYASDEYYTSGRVKFGLCDTLRGVLSQIDNMVAGLVRTPEEAPVQLPDSELRQAAQDVVDRWDSPNWKDLPATGDYIARLRKALSVTPLRPEGVPVQMPPPVAYLHPLGRCSSTDNYYLDTDWSPLYTEHQVRQLLAQHGIK